MRPRPERLWQGRVKNWLQTALIVAGLACLMAVPGWMLAGATGVLWSLALVGMGVYLGSRVPANLILTQSSAGLLRRTQAPALYALLDELYRRAGLTIEPTLYYVPSGALNAFAVGDWRDGGIAVTDGLLRTLEPRELAGVLAHEVSHLRHGDTRVMSMAAAMTQLTVMGATLLQMVLLLMLPWAMAGELDVPWLALLFAAVAPTLSSLLQLALSRNREYAADLEAAAVTGDAHGLASALEALERHHGSWLESIFGRRPPGKLARWLHTHPPTRERIRRLLEIAGRPHAPPRPAIGPGLSEPLVILERPHAAGGRYWILRRR